MSGLLALIVALLAGSSIALIFVGLALTRRENPVQERLNRYGGRQPRTLEEIELQVPFQDRAIKPIIQTMSGFVMRFAPQRNIEALQQKLDMAGNPNDWTPAEFMGVRGLSALVTGAVPGVLFFLAHTPPSKILFFVIALVVLGFFLPTIWLGQKIRQRQHEIVKALPDALDLLTISVEAGLGFDAALSKVNEKWDNELSQAFGRVISELRLGKSRREALREMAYRMDVDDVTSFAAAIIQADQLGVSIAKVLRIQSKQMRIKRRQRAEEMAQKAPIKMLIPLAFLIFPSLFIVLLGPAIPRLIETFKGI